jgi:hypothetical protein
MLISLWSFHSSIYMDIAEHFLFKIGWTFLATKILSHYA